MKKIKLTIKEFYLFKQVSDFWYSFTISKKHIIVEADAKMLEGLGY